MQTNNMTKRVLFLAGSCGREIWMEKIYQEMNKHEEIIPHYLATGQKIYDNLLSLGVSPNNITKIFASQEKAEPNLAYLKECEKKYNINIWDAWFVSAVRSKKRAKIKPKEVLSYFQVVFEKTEKIVQEFQPEYYVCYGPAGYHSIIFHEVFRHSGVHIVEIAASMLPNRFVFAENLSNIWPSLVEAYADIKKDGLTEKEKEEAIKFIEDFSNRPEKPDCSKKFSEPLANRVKRLAIYGQQFVKYGGKGAGSWLKETIYWPIKQKAFDTSGIFDSPRNNEKYVFFPLHFQPESTTLIYGKWYVEQATLIENISKSIPVSHKLYVKEHPFGYGNRELSFYKRIKRLHNVRLLGPHEDIFKLIKNCSLLTTITGTGGWEAMLFQIPAITFGNIFYNVSEETTKVTNIEELPKIIRKKIDQKIDYQKLIHFVAAMFRCSYEGLARLPSDCSNHSLEEENIKLLVAGIHDYMHKKEAFITHQVQTLM